MEEDDCQESFTETQPNSNDFIREPSYTLTMAECLPAGLYVEISRTDKGSDHHYDHNGDDFYRAMDLHMHRMIEAVNDPLYLSFMGVSGVQDFGHGQAFWPSNIDMTGYEGYYTHQSSYYPSIYYSGEVNDEDYKINPAEFLGPELYCGINSNPANTGERVMEPVFVVGLAMKNDDQEKEMKMIKKIKKIKEEVEERKCAEEREREKQEEADGGEEEDFCWYGCKISKYNRAIERFRAFSKKNTTRSSPPNKQKNNTTY